jgi:hypothetical protein
MIGRHQFYVPGSPRLTRAEPKTSGDELTSAVRAFKEAPTADDVREEAIHAGGRAI